MVLLNPSIVVTIFVLPSLRDFTIVVTNTLSVVNLSRGTALIVDVVTSLLWVVNRSLVGWVVVAVLTAADGDGDLGRRGRGDGENGRNDEYAVTKHDAS